MPDPTRTEALPEIGLYVDMDGALCATDTLWESLVELAKKKPLTALQVPFWILQGKPAFKRHVANHVLPDIATLPIRPEVLELLNARRAAGQKLYLATAADEKIATAVAERLGIFSGVLASNGKINLAAKNKLAAIQAHAGDADFDYLGDSKADLCLFHQCRQGYVAGTSTSVWRQAEASRDGRPPLTRLVSTGGGIKAVVKALRPHQWAKNALIGVPLVVSHQVAHLTPLWQTFLAFWAFSFTASSVYVVNDLLDLPADRAHPSKRRRPFASGAVPIPTGILLTVALTLGGLGLAFGALGPHFGGMILLYVTISTLYSTVLKRKIVLDVFVLAGLYTLRILTGAVAINVTPSEWLLAFSMFIFTSLAMLKRYAELKTWSLLNEKWPAGRRYTTSDMDLFRSIGASAAYAAVLVFALYISSRDVSVLYRRPQVLWMVCPVMLYWLTRLWFLTNRNKILDDPVLFALTDRASLACGVAVMGLVLLAT